MLSGLFLIFSYFKPYYALAIYYKQFLLQNLRITYFSDLNNNIYFHFKNSVNSKFYSTNRFHNEI